jgi:hypothetical protein
MSTATEIQRAILQLPDEERQEIAHWMFQQRLAEPGRRYTDDGLDIEETQRKLDEAAKGSFRPWSQTDWDRLEASVR